MAEVAPTETLFVTAATPEPLNVTFTHRDAELTHGRLQWGVTEGSWTVLQPLDTLDPALLVHQWRETTGQAGGQEH